MSRATRPARAAVVGALLGPPAVTALLLALGYRLLPLGGLRGLWPVALYVVALAVLGATVAAALRLGLHATVVLAVVATVAAAVNGLFGPGPEWGDVLSFLAASMFLATGAAVVAVSEFALRYPGAAAREVSPRTVRMAATVGVGHLALWAALRSAAVRVPELPRTAFAAGLYAWLAIGGLALGAVPVVLWRERRLVAPAVVVIGALSLAAWRTLAGPTPGEASIAPSTLTLYGGGWFLPLAVALVAGAVEWAIRRGVSRRRSASP